MRLYREHSRSSSVRSLTVGVPIVSTVRPSCKTPGRKPAASLKPAAGFSAVPEGSTEAERDVEVIGPATDPSS
jgi:hypothetical protein